MFWWVKNNVYGFRKYNILNDLYKPDSKSLKKTKQ